MTEEYFLSINDVSKKLDVPAYTLRYWEKQFPTVIKPTTGAGGRRYYRGDTVSIINAVKDLLYNRGMTIAGVKKLLKEKDITQIADIEIVKPVAKTKPEPNALFTKSDDMNQAIDLLKRAKNILDS